MGRILKHLTSALEQSKGNSAEFLGLMDVFLTVIYRNGDFITWGCRGVEPECFGDVTNRDSFRLGRTFDRQRCARIPQGSD